MGKTPNFSDRADKVLRILYRSTNNGQTIYFQPDEVSMDTLYELRDLSLIQMDERSPRRCYITDYGRRVYFECDTPEGCMEK